MYKILKIEGSMYSYVDTNGCVYTRRDGQRYYKMLAQQTNNSGYSRTAIRMENGDVKYFLTHRLVAQAFINNPDGKETVNHIDGLKTNNSLSNLEWSSREENLKHAVDNNLITGNPGYEYYIPGIVEKIKEEYKGNYGDKVRIAKKYNISQHTVTRIVGKYNKDGISSGGLPELVRNDYTGRYGDIKRLATKFNISPYKVKVYLGIY